MTRTPTLAPVERAPLRAELRSLVPVEPVSRTPLPFQTWLDAGAPLHGRPQYTPTPPDEHELLAGINPATQLALW